MKNLVMTEPLRIAVADDESDMRDFFQTLLPRLGHQVVAVAENGRALVEYCARQQPDLVITDIKMPEMDGIQAASAIYASRPVPVILVSAYHDQQLIGRAEREHIAAYLVKPIKLADLETTIALAMTRFDQLQTLRHEANDLRQALEDRKVIERAKSILMRRAGIDEQASFVRLQKLASQNNKKLVDVAHCLLLGEEAFRPEKS